MKTSYPKCKCGRLIKTLDHLRTWSHHVHLYGKRTHALQATLRWRGWVPASDAARFIKGSGAPWKKVPKIGGFVGFQNHYGQEDPTIREVRPCLRTIWASTWSVAIGSMQSIPPRWRRAWVKVLNEDREMAHAVCAQLSMELGEGWVNGGAYFLTLLRMLPRVWARTPTLKGTQGSWLQASLPEHHR